MMVLLLTRHVDLLAEKVKEHHLHTGVDREEVKRMA
jgi:hypothetical protein